jgi:hypothetical protein
LIVVSDLSGELSILINDVGSFSDGGTISLGARPQAIDVWAPPQSPPVVAVAAFGASQSLEQIDLERPGFGAVFSITGLQATPIKMGDGPIDVAVDDFDEDGRPDFVSAALRSTDFHLHLSRTDQTVRIGATEAAISVAAGDFDGDGHQDIVLAGHGSADDSLQILFGDGRGGFARRFAHSSFPQVISVGTANMDGVLGDELIVLGYQGDLGVFRVGSSDLLPLGSAQLGSGTTKFEVGDINRDGRPDIAVVSAGIAEIDLLVGNGAGGLTAVRQSNAAMSPVDVAFGDFDGDQVDELAVVNVFQHGSPDGFSLPSVTTQLKLNVSLAAVVITANVSQHVALSTSLGIPFSQLDVNGDTSVTASDALRVINRLNRVPGMEGESVSITLNSPTDVNGDGKTTASDALSIINRIGIESLTEDVAAIDLVFRQGLV